jgi:hypothetical protein
LSAAVLAIAALLAAAACGDADPAGDPDSGPVLTLPPLPPSTTAPATTPADQGPTYAMTGSLCRRADLTPIAEIYPTADTPLADSARLCHISYSSPRSVVAFSLDAELFPDGRWAREYLDTARRKAPSQPTDIAGAGAAAFWFGDERAVELNSQHGNLVLQIQIEAIRDADKLPDDTPERLARVAAGTFARLAP